MKKCRVSLTEISHPVCAVNTLRYAIGMNRMSLNYKEYRYKNSLSFPSATYKSPTGNTLNINMNNTDVYKPAPSPRVGIVPFLARISGWVKRENAKMHYNISNLWVNIYYFDNICD